MNWRVLRTLVVVAAILALPVIAYAQEGSVAGTITDSTGAVLPGVTVTATQETTGNTFTSVTDERGAYRIPVRIGTYRIIAELVGFTTINRTGLEVLVGQTVALNLQMSPSGVQESVTVTGAAPLVDTSTSTVGGNVDSRQMQELPLNGRNFLDLAILAQGARNNSTDAGGAPVVGGSNGTFQINIDGQQVTNNCCGNSHQASFSRDAIAEFEFIANRFDATQGRSSGIQVNVITKSGTNTPSGTASGYFRSDKFNAADFIAKDANGNPRVLPYSDQQLSWTYGGPIVKNKVHYFGSFEFERQPQTITFNSPYPLFNIDLPSTEKQYKAATRTDVQFSGKTRLSLYGNLWRDKQPVAPTLINSATSHPSQSVKFLQYSNNLQGVLTQVLTNKTLNEVKFGWANTYWDEEPNVTWSGATGLAAARKSLSVLQPSTDPSSLDVHGRSSFSIYAPNISLPGGYTIGPASNYPQLIGQDVFTLRNDLTSSYDMGGRHDVKIGGEYLKYLTWHYWCNFLNGSLTANKGPALPASLLQSLFPVWNDPSTWNLAGLPLSTMNQYQTALGNCNIDSPRNIFALWYQDDWRLGSRLALNVGLRYDVETGPFANELQVPSVPGALGEVFLKANRPIDTKDLSPRLGFVWSLNDRTVIRGGGGLYYSEVSNQAAHPVRFATVQVVPNVQFDGRPDFATNPFNGPLPTFATIQPTFCNNQPGLNFALANPGCTRRAVGQTLVDPHAKFPHSYQASIGFQRQVGETMAVTSDYAYTGLRGDRVTGYNVNLGWNPATGKNYPFSTDFADRPYPDWQQVLMDIFQGVSDIHSVETSWTKRMSSHWQASGTYTLSWFYDGTPAAYSGVVGTPFGTGGPIPFQLAEPFNAQYGLAVGDQRHRAVFNGIWDAGHGFQLSGLYFFGSGQRYATTYGGDVANTGGTVNAARVRPDGTVVPRNNFVGRPLHRVDVRLQKRLRIRGNSSVDGLVEVFNLFNHANYGSYVTAENSSGQYGLPQANLNVAYQPRMMQLGFRIAF